ncbi:MAG: GerMN domain-containing protein [Oscillospiraceae bacterium]|jgi:germination protein M|nr:GerMN domain-containing protein [Oscillospiraceae bacterium]
MKKRLLPLFLALNLLCASCGGVRELLTDPSVSGKGLTLYYLAGEGGERGQVLDSEFRETPGNTPTAADVMPLLLAGPETPGLRSPFPSGTVVRSCREEGELAVVDLSEAYGGLSGVDLTLADGCIVLSLCGLGHISRVYLTVEGRPRPFRDQVYTAQDFLLDNGSGGERQQTVRLWFLQGETIAPEERTLTLRMGDQTEIAVLQALLKGPESGELEPVCPPDTALLSLGWEGNRCTVDLSGGWLEGEEDPRRILAVAETLTELNPEAEILFQVEGIPLESFGGVDLDELLGAEPKD